ncbi:MAG: Yip1 family protein [Candidatus Bathyarchaeales archaeon]
MMAAENRKVSAYNIFKVVYAPQKAFKEIAQNPKYIGPILIMILFIAGNTAFIYMLISKTYFEQTIPYGDSEKKDEWTENATLWMTTQMSGINITENYADYVNSMPGIIPIYLTIYSGNKSIQFSINESTTIWVQLDNIGPIDCSESGYNSTSLRIKSLSPEENATSATIYLYSTGTDYFSYDFTSKLDFASAQWNNVTLPLRTQEWQESGNANWSNINALKLEFTWSTPKNITLLVDGLFFHGTFSSPSEHISEYLFTYSINSFMQFTINWVVLGGLIYIMSKAFRGKTVWKISLIMAGFALITLFIQSLIYLVIFSSSPTIYYRLEILGKVAGESEKAYDNFAAGMWIFSTIYQYASIAISIWTVVLCAIATRVANEFSWSKSALIAVVAYYATVIIMNFLLS